MKKHKESTGLVLKFFKGDWEKTFLWFTTPNPLFGEVSPWYFGEFKGEERMTKIIKRLLGENKRSK